LSETSKEVLDAWFCDKKCKITPGGAGPWPTTRPDIKEIIQQHESAGCKGIQFGQVPDSFAYGVRVDPNIPIEDETQEEETKKLGSLTEIEDPRYAENNIHVSATLASNSISYNIPSEIEISCHNDNLNHNCDSLTKLKLEGSKLVQCVDVSDYVKETQLVKTSKKEKGFHPDCKLNVNTLSTTTLKKIRIRPVVSSLEKNDGKFFDGDGNEWKSYDAYFRQDQIQTLEAGTEIDITGRVIPDPKNQKVTLLIHECASAEKKEYDLAHLNSLKLFCSDKTPSEIVDFYCKEFEKYSKIIKRNDITLCGLLTFCSLTHVEFEGSVIPAWLKCIVIGDSTTGKSETVRKLIILLKGGQMVSGETASIVGLAGTTTQSNNNSWFIEWGPLVLQDKKLLAIDGAHQLGREHWAQLAESERTGKIQIMKAGKGEAYARTRQIKIMNPIGDDFRTPRTMKSFFYPAQAIVNNLQIQSIARQDLVVFVSDDVTTEQRNIRNGHTPDEKLAYLSDLVHMVWEQNFKVIFEEEAKQEILKVSTHLEKRFKHDEIPLITNDQKYKVAKLSSSLATLTCSFNDDFSNLIVKKEHVQYIGEIIEKNYHSSGLDIISKNDRDDLDEEDITDIIFKLKQSLSKKEPEIDEKFCKNILLWCVQKTRFTKEQLQSAFELARDNEVRPLIAVLRNESLLDQKKGFIPTSKLIKLAKILSTKQQEEANKVEEGYHLDHAKETKEAKTIAGPTHETFENNSDESLASLARLGYTKHDTPSNNISQNQSFTCQNCSTSWKDTNLPLEEIQTQHSMNHENHKVIPLEQEE